MSPARRTKTKKTKSDGHQFEDIYMERLEERRPLYGGRNDPPSPMLTRPSEWCATPEVGPEGPPPETTMAETKEAECDGMQTDAEKPNPVDKETHASSKCVESPST